MGVITAIVTVGLWVLSWFDIEIPVPVAVAIVTLAGMLWARLFKP